MGLIPRANTAAFLDPNLLSQRLEELYAGPKSAPCGGRKEEGAGAADPPAGGAVGGERAGAGAVAAVDGRGVPAAAAGLDPLLQRAALAGVPPRQGYVGAVKRRVSGFWRGTN